MSADKMEKGRSKLYEDYEDSLFKLVMNDAAAREGYVFLKEKEILTKNGEITSPEEMQKFNKLLNAAVKKQSRQRRPRDWYKMVNAAAIILLALSLAVSVSMITVEAFRAQVLNFILEMKEEFTTIEFNEKNDVPANNLTPIIDWKKSYVPTYLPDGYRVDKVNDMDAFKSITLINEEGLFIKYAQYEASSSINLDTENASAVENIQIGNIDAMLVVKDSITSIVWNQDHLFFIVNSQMSRDETIKFVESVKLIE